MTLLDKSSLLANLEANFTDGGEATAAEFRALMTDVINSVYLANGMNIERLYDGESSALEQQPNGKDVALRLKFGAVEGTSNDPVQTLPGTGSEAEILQINKAGLYRVKIAIQYGRTDGANIAILNFRALLNGVQAGRSVNQRLENANQTSIFSDEAWLYLPAGVQISYEVIRDSNGANSGGLVAGETSGSTGWNPAPSMSLRVERFVNQ